MSDPEIFHPDIRPRIRALSTNPEAVNSGHPPARRLDSIYESTLKRGYKKTVDGRNLFGVLNPDRAVEKCPYLRSLLGTMLTMAHSKGIATV